SITVSNLSAATTTVPSHVIKAIVTGTTNFKTSTGLFTQKVNAAGTTTSLVSSAPAGSVKGQMVTFTATVAPVARGPGTPAGTVYFYLDPSPKVTLLGSAALNGAVAAFSISGLAVGTRPIFAYYAGSTSFAGSNSKTTTPLAQVVSAAQTQTT